MESALLLYEAHAFLGLEDAAGGILRYDDHKMFRYNPYACVQTLRDGKQKWVRVPEVTRILSRIKNLDDIISDKRRITSMHACKEPT